MAGISYTDEQKNVIEARGCNLLVSAAAGSGKTAVLTARILSLLTDPDRPADIDRMLIVTFTRAAAAEMRERIGNAIADYAAEHPGDRRMERQATLLHNAQITTIDSFCLFVVRNNFSDIDLDPAFRILDEGERQLLLSDVLDRLLEEEYAEEREDFLHLVESYCTGSSETALREMLLTLYEYAESHPDPARWVTEAAKDAGPETIEETEKSRWYLWGKERAEETLTRILQLMDEAQRLAEDPAGPAAYIPAISQLKLLSSMLLAEESYARRVQILETEQLVRLSSAKKKSEDLALRTAAKLRIDKARGLYASLRIFYPDSPENLLAQNAFCRKSAAALSRLCLKLMEAVSEEKRSRGVVDFSDMEHYALRILLREEGGRLVPKRAAEEYRDYFEHIFVDEYQDSNFVQEYILKSIAREDDYYCVGDVKQSIYRFRQARPEIFLEKYERYGETGIDRRIDLNRNFRSRPEVVDFVNLIFSVIMKKSSAGMDYDEKAQLYAKADYPKADGDEYATELNVLLTDSCGEEDEEEELQPAGERPPGKTELECRMVAERIRSLMRDGFKVWDRTEERLRPVRYNDIVLLARSTTAYEEPLRQCFAAYGIPLFCTARSGYFKAWELRCLMAALKVIDNPCQDMPLHAALVHFLELMSEEELALIKAATGKPALYDALRAAQEDEALDAGLRQRIRRFFEWLEKYRSYARYMKVRELLQRLLAESDYPDRVSAYGDGARRRANIKLLMERASDYEKTSYRGLFHFIRYLSQMKEQELDYGEAGMTDENADVVRVMTIHKSKGLEFPVVFCLGLYRKFNRKDSTAALLLDTELGMAPEAVDPGKRIRYPGLKRKILGEKNRDDSLAEDMRVLYVALTRAKEKLILTDIRKTEAELSEPPAADAFSIRAAANPMELIRLALEARGLKERFLHTVSLEDGTTEMTKKLKRAFGDRELLFSGDLPCDPRIVAAQRAFSEKRYAHPELKGLFTKTSVSELKHEAYAEEEEA
ncbi:MAG: helicase-exonuclease AddAB subunit AddA, partial [Lachnospiraceae bacterium]|nr:helicase-exonuclease AddAB subunit AddA [Lachnospiraceae bacterium]